MSTIGKDLVYYHYNVFGKRFISFDDSFKTLNIDDYTKFIESTTIPNIPEHIISAEADVIDKYGKKSTIDILEHIQELCGPYIDQIVGDNKKHINLYLIHKLVTVDKIIQIEIMYTDGDEINLSFND